MIELLREPLFLNAGIEVGILRLDKIHPVVSGNKIFKLKYFLKEANERNQKTVVTVGGPYSNHLHATAFATTQLGLQSIGLLNGNRPAFLSPTLKDCMEMGMKLQWMPNLSDLLMQTDWMEKYFPDSVFIPQGGLAEQGVKGAAEIMEIPGVERFDTIIAACGTGTMGAGLASGRRPHQTIQLISVLKNNFSVREDICKLLSTNDLDTVKCRLDFSHHLGGYAKKSFELFNLMNTFYEKHQIPTDFVYTGKVVHALYKKIQSSSFSNEEKVLLIHSGGLQGNRSLNSGELIF